MFPEDWLWNLGKRTAALACVVWLVTGRPDHILESARNAKNLPHLLNQPIKEHEKWLSDASQLAEDREIPFLRALEIVVLTQVPWASDWKTWGVREFFPTPEQVATTRREDCDGRAILFVNLARCAGYSDVQLAWGAFHVWALDGQKSAYLLEAPEGYTQEVPETIRGLEFGDGESLDAR